MNDDRPIDGGGNRISRQLNVRVSADPIAAAPTAVGPVAPGPVAPGQGAAGQGAAGQGAGSQGAAAGSGLASWAVTVNKVAAELQRRAADLTTAARAASGRQYQARSGDGGITVTVDGRPRVADIRITGETASSAPDGLARALTDTVNRALEDARLGTQTLLGEADPALQAWISEGADAPGGSGRSLAAAARAEAAARMTTATSTDDTVTATVSGSATVVSIELPHEASREEGQARLGESVAEAVNAALAGAEQRARDHVTARALSPAPDPWSAGKTALDALASRMDLLLDQLDRIDRGLVR